MEPVNVYASRARLGEGPIWDDATQSLYFVDIYNHRVHRFSPDGGRHRVYDVGDVVTFVALGPGSLVLGLRHHVAVLDPETERLRRVVPVELDRPRNRLNDGKCDPQGRLWFGSMAKEEGGASLYRLDPDGSLHTMETRLTISNGLGWSPDGRTFYLTDSPTRTIFAYDFHPETGDIDGRRVFADLSDGSSFPDGLSVDAEGCVWSAQWDGWGVVRIDPDGRRIGGLRLPVRQVTSCAFGGADLRDLYVTTASVGLSQDEVDERVYSGDLFRARSEVAGLPVARFAGDLRGTGESGAAER